MGEGATGGLETDPSLQRHSKGKFWLSEGTQPGVRDSSLLPGCWGIGIPWDTTYLGSTKPLASLGLRFLICELE